MKSANKNNLQKRNKWIIGVQQCTTEVLASCWAASVGSPKASAFPFRPHPNDSLTCLIVYRLFFTNLLITIPLSKVNTDDRFLVEGSPSMGAVVQCSWHPVRQRGSTVSQLTCTSIHSPPPRRVIRTIYYGRVELYKLTVCGTLAPHHRSGLYSNKHTMIVIMSV